MRKGLGARLEASFRPAVHWGAEFLADRVRICGLREEGGAITVAAVFEGPYGEADAFARSHGLAHAGLHAAVSHLPFKIEAVGAESAAGDDDILPQAERLKPTGLTLEALDVHGFSRSGERCLVMAREDAVRGLVERLPGSLSELWDLCPSPLALLPHALPPTQPPAGAGAPERRAALLVEEGYTHVLFLRGEVPVAYAKAFTGLEEARRDPAAYARELKKVLVYHYGGRFAGAALEGFSIWRDGAEGEAAAALSGLDLPRSAQAWAPDLADPPPTPGTPDKYKVPADFKVAGAMALLGLREAEPPVSFSVSRPRLAQNRGLWMRRTGLLARAGYQVIAVGAVIAALLVAGAGAFRWLVEAKARTWSGELRKWDQFQDRRASVEKQVESLHGLISRRTEGYASLQRIAAALPPEVWLEEWEAEAGAGNRFVHRLTGYSLAEDRVPQFLAGLEDGKRFRSVKLKSTERIKGEKVEKETGIAANRRDLIRFQMVVAE